MEHVGNMKKGRGSSRGKEKIRRRAVKALAAAGAIAGGTQAYAEPLRFDNPAHGEAGHFHWVGPIESYVWLDFANGADAQSVDRGPTTVGQRVFAAYANLVGGGIYDEVALQAGGDAYPYRYFALGLGAGALIPDAGTYWRSTPTYIYYAGWPGPVNSMIPEGQAAYLGVKFDVGNGTQYGWIGVVRTGIELEAFAWGFESNVGVPIAAGAGVVAAATGACCEGQEACQEITLEDCEAMGWRYIGDNIGCEEGTCNIVPTVSEWGLAIMSLSLLAAGTWAVRKKQVPQS